MKAVVKVAYFDNSGLHKAGEVVEVKKLNSFLSAIAEPAKVKKVEEPTEEAVEIKTKPKKATRKTTKKSKKV